MDRRGKGGSGREGGREGERGGGNSYPFSRTSTIVECVPMTLLSLSSSPPDTMGSHALEYSLPSYFVATKIPHILKCVIVHKEW